MSGLAALKMMLMASAACVMRTAQAQEIRQGAGTTCNLQCTCEDDTTGALLPLQVIVGGVTLAEEVTLCDEQFICRGCRACSTLCNCNTQTCVGDCFKPAGVICQDPHVKGYDGRTFDFQGLDGAFYALISDRDVQVNMRTTWNGYDQSFIDQLGVVLPDGHTVSVLATPSGNAGEGLTSTMSVLVDGAEVPHEDGKRFAGNAEVSWTAADDKLSSAVITIPDVLTLRVSHNELVKEDKRHLDIQTEFFRPSCAPHGVLGQTLQASEFALGGGRRSALSAAVPDNGLGGLSEDAFRVSSLFHHDFAHSVFGKPCGKLSEALEVFEWGGVTLRLHPLDAPVGEE